MDYLDRFRKRRKEIGLRQTDVSAETRKNKMDVETFAAICRLLCITPDEALGFDE